MDLSNNEKRMLKALRSDGDQTWDLDSVLAACGWNDQAHVAGAGLALTDKGLVEIETVSATLWSLGPEGVKAHSEGLLERRLFDFLIASEDKSMRAVQASGVASTQSTSRAGNQDRVIGA